MANITGSMLGPTSGRREKEIYYRRPMRGQQAGWIIWGGSRSGTILQDFIRRGFQPLYDYGELRHDLDTPWRQILEHPNGPAEFPVDQVITLRWYTDPPIEGVKFPQLQGHKVKEYKCPECDRDSFIAVDGLGGIEHLARHLRLMHDWDRQSLTTYGKQVGIDFDAIYTSAEWSFDEVELGQDEIETVSEPELEVEKVEKAERAEEVAS